MWRAIRRISGRSGPERGAAAFVLALLVGGCNYTFQAGAGLPAHVQTLAIIPFENQTDRFEISQELHELLLEELPSTFGVRTGGEEFAEAVVEGSVVNYEVGPAIYEPGPGNQAQVVERQVLLTVSARVVDQVNEVILWENAGLTARGEFLEETEREEDGRQLALTRVAQAIIDGLQSNW